MTEDTSLSEIVLGPGALVRDFDPSRYPDDTDLITAARAAVRGEKRIGVTSADGGGARFTVTETRPDLRPAGTPAPLTDCGPVRVTAELTVDLAFTGAPPRRARHLCWIGERVDGGITLIHLPVAHRMPVWRMVARGEKEAGTLVGYTACAELTDDWTEDSLYRVRTAGGTPA